MDHDRPDEAAPTCDDFIGLSACLTGVAGLDADLASEYLCRFRAHPTFGGLLPALVDRYNTIVAAIRDRAGGADRLSWEELMDQAEPAVGEQILDDPVLSSPARQLIYLWYVGAFFEADPTEPARGAWQYGTNPEHYGRGLMWAVIRAHAPMTPGTGAPHDGTPSTQNNGPYYWSRPPDLHAPVSTPPPWFDR